MLKTRIAVLVSGGGSNLQALIDNQESGKLKSGEIVLVIADNPGAYALKRAEKHGIPSVVCDRKALGSQSAFEAEIEKNLREYDAGMIVLAGFMKILTSDFTSKYPERIINIHPALIPSFCGKGYYGLHVHEAALAYGVKVTGATVHYVNEVPDGGRIIIQKAVYINKNDTPETLQKRVMRQAEWKILPKAAEMVAKKLQKENREKR